MFNVLGFLLTKRRPFALGVVFISALLTLADVPLTWLGILIIGLITLAKGEKEGFLVVLWFLLPGIAMAVVEPPPLWLLSVVVFKAVLMWGLAAVLRRTHAWSYTLQAGAIVGAVTIVVLHVMVPDLQLWWVKQLTPLWQSALQTLHLQYTPSESHTWLAQVAQYATGSIVAVIVAIDVGMLLLARAWQASFIKLQAPRKELYIRMHYGASVVLLVCGVAVGFQVPLAQDILPVLLVPFVFAALNLIHSQLVNKKHLRAPILAVLYVTFLLFLPYMAILLALVGLIDSCYNLRAFAKKKPQPV